MCDLLPAGTPALAAGTLYDVEVTMTSTAAELSKGWFADFADVPQAFLYHAAIEKIYRAGITSGCGGGMFCPNDPVTRDAMAKFLELAKRGSSFSPPAATGTVFCDATASTFLAKWIEQLSADGITSGCGSGSCGKPNSCPGGTVSRGEMAKFWKIAFGL